MNSVIELKVKNPNKDVRFLNFLIGDVALNPFMGKLGLGI